MTRMNCSLAAELLRKGVRSGLVSFAELYPLVRSQGKLRQPLPYEGTARNRDLPRKRQP